MKKKIVTLCLVVCLLAIAVMGSTLAYLNDTDAKRNVMTVGKVDIIQNEQQRGENNLEPYVDNMVLYPAVYAGSFIPWAAEADWIVPNDLAWRVVEDNVNVRDKIVTVTNNGNVDAYVRTIILFEGDAINGQDIHLVCNNIENVVTYVFVEDIVIKNNRYDAIVFTYAQPLGADETTVPSLKQVYADKTSTNNAANTSLGRFGAKYEIYALSQAVQVSGFSTAAEALDSAFGAADKDNIIKWMTDLVIVE